MIEILEYTDAIKESWDSYVQDSTSATIAHQAGWRKVINKSLGHKPVYILAMENGKIAGILPIFKIKTWWGTRSIVSIPWLDYGGVIADSEEIALKLLLRAGEITREYKAEFIEYRSIQTADPDLPVSREKVSFWLELEKDSDALWKRFDGKLRNQIRKSDKSGLTTTLGGTEQIASFYEVFSHNMRDLGTPVWGRDFFENILNEFSDDAKIILVKSADKVIAGGLVLYFKDRIYVPSASSYRDYIKMCPNHALYWSLIKSGCEQGYKYFDFGRSGINSNTYNFKKQWCPESTQLNWQYYLNTLNEIPTVNPTNPKYHLIINIWRKLPISVANFLGPKVIRNFP
ncbi:MAG: FemAB family XrtA/PEP-CTERM system-associated protein [Candidatus Zixiibacteriota bacterium]